MTHYQLKRERLAVVLSVLLARQNSELLVAVTSRMEESPQPATSIGELVTIFIEDVTRTVHRYYLIINGIDRVTDLAQFLANLDSSRPNIPNIIALSRPEPEIINILNKYPMISMTRDQGKGDTKCVLPSYISDLITAWHPIDRRKIEYTFMKSHNGSFFMVLSCFEVSQEHVSASNSLHAISCISIKIFDLYAWVFDCLTQEPDTFKRDTEVRSLRWIAIAQRPLDISELEVALLTAENQTEFKYDTRLIQLEDILCSNCDPLLDISSTAFDGSRIPSSPIPFLSSIPRLKTSSFHSPFLPSIPDSLSTAHSFMLLRPASISPTCTSPSPRCISSVIQPNHYHLWFQQLSLHLFGKIRFYSMHNSGVGF